MSGGSDGFRRADRLRSPKDFRRVSREGRRVSSRHFVLLCAPAWPSPAGASRLGLTVSRSVGGSVVRNRIKRRVREWFRHAKGIPQGKDLVVIARAPARELSGAEIAAELDALVRRTAGGRAS